MDKDIDMLKDLLGVQFSNDLARVLIVVLVLLLTWLVRRLVTLVTPRLVHFLARSTRSTLDEQLVTVLAPPVRLLIGVFGLWLAFLVIGVQSHLGREINRLMSTLVAIAVFWALYRAVELAVVLLQRVLEVSSLAEAALLQEKMVLVLRQLIKGLILVLAVVALLEKWGYNVGGLLAGLGLGGLAVALAAQEALANLIGYFMIVTDEPFVRGDYIIMNDVAGIVEGIGVRSTRVRVLDQSLVIVPNKMMTSEVVTNWSRLTKRRLNMTLGLAMDTPSQQVLAVVQGIREMLKTHSLVHPESVIVQFADLGESSLNLTIICFMKTPAWDDFQAARQDINLKILDVMALCGVENANPAYEIIVKHRPSLIEQLTEQETLPQPAPEPPLATVTDSPVPPDAANA